MLPAVKFYSGVLRATACLVLTSPLACSFWNHPSEGAESEGVTFEVIANGGGTLIVNEQTGVIRDQTNWEQFWLRHSGGKTPAPIVDFGKEMVVAVYLGGRPTGGYAVKVVKIEETAKNLVVNYEEQRPGARCFVTQATTSPFQIVRLPRAEKDVVFIKVVTVIDC